MFKSPIILILLIFFSLQLLAADPFGADTTVARNIPNMKLAWSDEFNTNGKPNPDFWNYETGFKRNEELQWYKSDNANCKNGLLIIDGKRDTILNPNYVAGSTDWKKNRRYAYYSSASITSSKKVSYMYGRIEVRARIDSTKGSWPAIWTLGTSGEWPSCGEVDIMEFYRSSGVPSILANVAWGTSTRWVAKWDGSKKALYYFLNNDPEWVRKFHIWRMDWNKDSINLYLDNELLNYTLLNQTINPKDPPVNPFLQEHYFLLNLAIGSNGGDPSKSVFPIKYEVDYIRVYQEDATLTTNTSSDNSIFINQYNKSLKIDVNESHSALTFELFNTNGICLHKRIIDSSETVDLNFLTPGIYFLRVFNDKHFISTKIIINN